MKFDNLITALFVCTSICACLDLSPVKFVSPNAPSDAGVDSGSSSADGGGPDSATAARIDACRMCLTSGACSNQSTPCIADSKCSVFFGCLTDRDCWKSKIVDANNVAPCLTDCGDVAMFTNQLDPSVLLVTPVFICAQDPAACASSCAPNL